MDMMWSFFFILERVFGIHQRLSPPSSLDARRILFALINEYLDPSGEGLTRNTALELLGPIDPHLRQRLAYASEKPLVCQKPALHCT